MTIRGPEYRQRNKPLVFVLFTLISLSISKRLPAQITFEEITTVDFLDSESYFHGISWVDVDNDHDLDVCLTGNGGTFPDFVNNSAIFINDGLGNFTNTGLLISAQDNPMGHGWADFDNDGDLDLYIGATWNSGGINEFWVNESGGSFTLTQNSGSTPGTSQPYEGSVSWADYDNDGFVDLFLPRWNDQTDRLYHNNGDGTFSLITGQAPIQDAAWTSSGSWGDYDNDGDADLYVANYQFNLNGPGVNRLYKNNGDGTFEQVPDAGEIVTDGQSTRSANWVDVNNDGLLDMFVANQGNPSTGSDGFDKLYINNGDGTFSTQIIGADQTTWSSNWGDYDNDGDQDLVTMSFWGSDSKMWENDGSGNFTDISTMIGPVFPLQTSGSWANGVVFVDYDQDGWLDLHLIQPDVVEDHLYRNQGDNCVSWLSLELDGIVSNGAAIGAKAYARAIIDGSIVWQSREVSAQSSKPGQNPLWLHFGFGDAVSVDSLIIAWPSGDSCFFNNLAVNQFLEIEESCDYNVIVPPPLISGSYVSIDWCGNGIDTLLNPPSGPGGTWWADCGDCIDQSGLFMASGLPSGDYEIYYNLGGICGTTDTLAVSLQSANAGSDTAIEFCENEGPSDLFSILNGSPNDGGQWFDENFEPIDPSYDPTQGDALLYYVEGTSGCTDTTEVIITINQVPDPVNITVSVAPGETTELDAGPGQIFSWSPAEGLSCTDCQTPVFSGLVSTNYTVFITDDVGCEATMTFEVLFGIEEAYDIPNAFSPNQDGNNDEFRVLAKENTFSSFSLKVFSRWGELVYSSKDPQKGWDGNYNGKAMPSDVYTYYFVFTLLNGEAATAEGEINLLR